MSGFGNRSAKEEDLLKEIRKKFPSADCKWFGMAKKGDIAKRFQLDIYIPELSAGVEFQGDYWHTTEMLRRGRKSWPIEMVKDYHNIKKNFFTNIGIEYIEVFEHEWDSDPDMCVNKVLKFLIQKNKV